MTIPRVPAALLWALAGALVAGLLVYSCAPHPVGPAVVQVDTADASSWRARSQQLERAMADSVGRLAALRRRLDGIETRRSERITVYDTVLSLVEDTVTLSVAIDGRGRLTQELALPDAGGGHRPASSSPILVGDCDGGLRLAEGRVQCNTPRLGHLMAFAAAGVSSAEVWASGIPPPVMAYGAVGLRWTPAYRSTWSAELRLEDDGRAVASIRKGLRLW
jgi:hypothetical protein